MRCRAPVALLLVTALASPSDLGAQQPPVDAWAFAVDLGFNGSSGNSSFAMLNTGFKVTHLRTSVAEFEVSLQYRYGESEDRVIARSTTSSVKFDLYPQATWSPFLFGTAYRDPIRHIDVRSNGGMGAKYTFWAGQSGKASISLAGIYNYEAYDYDDPATQIPTEKTVRWSWRVKGEQTFGGKVSVENTTFYQPVWDRSSDYYVDASSTASVTVGAGVSLFVQHQYKHDETPPPGVVSDDNNLSVGLRFLF